MTRVARLLLALLGAGLVLAGASAPVALAGSPWWRLDATVAPTNLPSHGEAQLVVTATNLGDAEVNASAKAVTFADVLPAGMNATAIEAEATAVPANGARNEELKKNCVLGATVTCTFNKTLPPFQRLMMRISVEVNASPQAELQNEVKLEGGDAKLPQPLNKMLHVSDQATPFGVESYELTPENEDGSPDLQGGSHPFQLTTSLDFNQTLAFYETGFQAPGFYPSAPALSRDLHFKLPPGLAGNPTAVPRCSEADFSAVGSGGVDLCPGDTALGVASVVVELPKPLGFILETVPVFNLEPALGEPARFGFEVENVSVVLKTAVPAGGEYAAEARVSNASQAAQVLSSIVTLWGVPGAASHDSARGWECLGDGTHELSQEPPKPCAPKDPAEPKAFLTMPTSCARPLQSSMGGDAWSTGNGRPGAVIEEGPSTRVTLPAPTGCQILPFNPTIAVEPEQRSASTPTGLDVEVKVPQDATLSGKSPVGEADVQDTTVTLPPGMQLNPSAANGLQTCSALQFGFAGSPEEAQTENLAFSPGSPQCPDAAKVGTVNITTPLLEGQLLSGSVYLAAQHTNPFASPLALYLVAEDPTAGVLVKLAGSVAVDPLSGQVTTTFENTPQLPFSDLKLHFFGGQRAPLSTPPLCGPYPVQTAFSPWSGNPPATPASAFAISSGAFGGPCPPSPLAFAPSFSAGPANGQAGAFSPFVVNIGRADGQQALSGISVALPSGFAAMLASVTPCAEPAGGQDWACGPDSLIGHASEVAGLGFEPVTLGGDVYLTSGYDGAPFGLLVRTHAAAGPFDLGYVNVRSRINVDPSSAAVTVTSDPGPRAEAIPTILKGVPVQLKALQVAIDREAFQFNPTNCTPLTITATLDGAEGAAPVLPYPFTASGCQSLPFTPKLTAATHGQASKANGASLVVKVSSSAGQANIAKTVLTLPKALPSRLTTLQKACLAATFEANPASCPEGSDIGTATVHTPVLRSALSGPAYLVSHGNAAFPDVEFVLQGEGIKLILDGQTQIKNGITTSSFNAVPDAPITSFEAVLPQGPHSVLTTNLPAAANYNLCATKLSMPTTITAQNGAVVEQSTSIEVQGCGAVKAFKAKKLTRKQKLARALKACRKRWRHSAGRRRSCEAKARRTYKVKAASHKRHRRTA